MIHSFKDIQDVPELTPETFVPRAFTPLLDAMGRGINDLGQQLAAMDPEKHPSKVVMVVITDGHENASREFRKDQVGKMIREKQEKLDWQFVFLSSDLEGINDAHGTGVRYCSSMRYEKSPEGTQAAWSSVSERISDYRSNRCENVSFTEEDRAKQDDESGR